MILYINMIKVGLIHENSKCRNLEMPGHSTYKT